MYEGAPNWPEPDRFWKIVQDYRVNILYTAPTAIRAFIRWGDQWVAKHDLSSLRLLGTVGSRSIPKHGSGITKKSAAAVVRLSIPGGKPKPAQS